jgi:predicted RNase H-like HicB family nuclease
MSDIRVEATQIADDSSVFTANFYLDQSGTWIVELEELPQVHSYGRTLGKAREYITDALALWLDVSVGEARARIAFATPRIPADLTQIVERALAERRISESVAKVAADAMVEASVSLVDDAHLSMRDAAEILGISHQRVQQLVSARRSDESVDWASAPSPDVVARLREFLPGGANQDLGLVAGTVAFGLAVAWIEYRNQSQSPAPF